jgi:hypothetical protein
MQAASTDPGGASKPVCRIALLPLDAPSSRSAAFSRSATRAPSSAKRRAMAQPITPPPTTITSWMSFGAAASSICAFLNRFRGNMRRNCPKGQFYVQNDPRTGRTSRDDVDTVISHSALLGGAGGAREAEGPPDEDPRDRGPRRRGRGRDAGRVLRRLGRDDPARPRGPCQHRRASQGPGRRAADPARHRGQLRGAAPRRRRGQGRDRPHARPDRGAGRHAFHGHRHDDARLRRGTGAGARG